MSRSRPAGFTLIELLVVVSIIGLLMTVAAPRYFGMVDRARITVLQENLRVTREAIDHFFADRGRYPESLEELVNQRYLRALPQDPTRDPLRDGAASWTLVRPPAGTEGQVYDLHSSNPSTLMGVKVSEL